MNKALRYNQGKTRYSLLPPLTMRDYFSYRDNYDNSLSSEMVEILIFDYLNNGDKKILLKIIAYIESLNKEYLKDWADVLTFGAEKYDDDNWRKGFKWRSIIDSMLRHYYAVKNDEHIDPESNLPHIGHILCNLGFLYEFHYIYPQGDDRPKVYNRDYRIGLDIDGVLADFWGKVAKEYNHLEYTNCWLPTYSEEWKVVLTKNPEFWEDLEATDNVNILKQEPICYITNRPFTEENKKSTQKWMEKNNFPCVPIYFTDDKVKIAKENNIDIFVDDNYDNFVKLNKAGIKTYLYSCPHNMKYDVGEMRICSLHELNKKLYG